MPVKRRVRKARDDYPIPWEPRPGSLDRWQRHRELLLANERAGRRPEEWWAYEAAIPWPGYDNETVALYNAGLLSDQELAELRPWWREQFERSFAPEFFHCLSSGRILEDAPARRALYRWACI